MAQVVESLPESDRLEEGRPGPALLRSKVAVPTLPPGHLARPRLLAALAAGSSRRLTLVAAPAGFGKTRLLVRWCQDMSPARPTAWLSLDEYDNDPVTFWRYLVYALRQAYPNRFRRSLAALARPGASLTRTVLPPLLNELWDADSAARLVLDDFHAITDLACIEAVRFFIDRLPPSLHVVIATRSDPPIGLARLRTRGELTELRAADLRFTPEEAAAFLNGSLGLDLSHDDLGRLQERTEGWAAGLYLAALSLRDHPDPSRFVSSFAGQHRHLVDYLGGEVLDRLSEEERGFLAQTAVLEQLTGPLCDAVLERGDAAERLRTMAQRNLFVFPLDEAWTWYRYHPLFRELLQMELERRFPERIPVLHQRAAAWYRAAGDAASAMHHALAAGDDELAGDHFLEHSLLLSRTGHMATVVGWIGRMSPASIAARPALAIAVAWVEALTGSPHAEIERLIAAAEAKPDSGPYFLGEPSLDAAVALVRAAFPFDNVGSALQAAQRLLGEATDPATQCYILARSALGQALYLAGRPAEARAPLEEVLRAPLAARQVPSVIASLGYLAQASLHLGEPERAETLAREAVRRCEAAGLESHPSTSFAYVALSAVLVHLGEFAEAEAVLARGVEPHLPVFRARPLSYARLLLALAPVRYARGHGQAAATLLADARAVLHGCTDPGMLSALLAETERRLSHLPRRMTGLRQDLSDGELRVLRLLVSDLSQREIGQELYLSVNTVKSHTRAIYTKLDTASRAEAVARARSLGLIA
jgi:LuxR family maltose regulon positive regulatory protein